MSMTFERQVAQVVALAVKTATAPLLIKIAVLEARPVVSQDVVDALKETIADQRARIMALETRAAVPGPAGPPGPKGDDGGIGPQGATGPAGEKGESGECGADGAPGARGEKGEPGINGKDGANGLDGKDGVPGLNGKDGAPGKDGAAGLEGKAGPEGPQGRDGRDGKDGAPGLTGRDGAPGANGKDGANGIDGKDGAPGLNGKDGAPGLSPDDFNWDFDPETRELSISLSREGTVLAEKKKILRGMRIYRKAYEAGRTYEEGDVVTWDGSEWTALAQTKDRPGNGDTAWKLTVKHGEKGKPGPEGKPGRDGRDLTQLGTDGRKWT